MDYTRAQTLEKCRQALKEPKLFCRADCVRYAGRCTDTKEYYTEIVAQFLLAHLEEYIAGIPQITRDGSYRTDTHDGVFNPNFRRKEEILAMQLFNCCKSGESFPHIGRILDYQTPLKSRQSDDAGKVDLLAYGGKCLRIPELKAEGPVFVLQASTNIDRIVTMYRAAKRSGRVFLEGLPMAAISASIGGSIPNPAFSDVFVYKTAYESYEELAKYENRMGKARMEKTPFVMCLRSSMLSYLKKLSETVSFAGGILVYSMWSGYRQQPQMQAFLEGCEQLGLRLVTLHTFGHADPAAIEALIAHTNPVEILPVHTEAPEWFADKSQADASC